MNKNKGFTLIELLVVIAIIGILASVVLASLSSARNKGKDAAVKSELSSMRAQAEIYYSKGETYVGICTDPAAENDFDDLIASVIESAGVTITKNAVLATAGTPALVTCHEKVDSWAVEAPLVADSNSTTYCVDSAGASMGTNVHLEADDTECTPTPVTP